MEKPCSAVTPVNKDVRRGLFTTETISCVVTGMVSTQHTITWVDNEKMSSEDISWAAPSYTSVLTLKEDLVSDDQTYTCRVQADPVSEVAEILVHLNFYCKCYSMFAVDLVLVSIC